MRHDADERVAEYCKPKVALEGVSLRYLREIYESLLTWSSREKIWECMKVCTHRSR